jgi:VWFA-related protein
MTLTYTALIQRKVLVIGEHVLPARILLTQLLWCRFGLQWSADLESVAERNPAQHRKRKPDLHYPTVPRDQGVRTELRMKQKLLKNKLGSILLVSLLFMVLMAPAAWSQPIQQITINYIEASTVPDQFSNEVRAFVTVSDADENSILGLSLNDFQAREDGREIAVEEVLPADDPMAIVLAIDTSGSMQAKDKAGQTSMAAAKRAALDFISMLSENDRVALFSFNNETTLHMDFSEDHEAAVNAVHTLDAKPNAATCLYDTAYEAVKKAAEIPRGRRAIILLTDVKDEKAGHTCSTYSSNDVIDAATTKTIRVPIYTIGVGPEVDARELGRIASLTGGRSLLATSLAELTGFYQIIANQLKNQYLVKYNTQAPSGEHSLVLKVQHEGSTGQDEKRFWAPPLPVLHPPSVSFVRPTPEEKISGTVSVKVSISPKDTLAKVRFYVDAALKEENTKDPFDSFKWNTAGLSSGLHVLRVEAVDIKGQSGYAEITQKIAGPPSAKQPSAASTQEIKRGIPTTYLVAGILLLLIILAGFFLLSRKRRKVTVKVSRTTEGLAASGAALANIEDETIFVPDDGEKKPHPPASLIVIESVDLSPGISFEIRGSAIIGRSSDNDIHIPDKPVSRRHAEVYFDNDICYVRDLGSKNGVKIDGRRIPPEGVSLYDGAKIQLGPKTILEFNIVDLGLGVSPDDKTRKYGV